MKYYIGIDIGTQSVKGGIFTEEMECLSMFSEELELHKKDGRITQNGDTVFEKVCIIINKLASISSGKIEGICVDGQMAGIMAIDKEGKAVGEYDSWLDTSCAKQIEELKERYSKEIIEKSLGQISFTHLPKILYQKENDKEGYDKTQAYVPLSGYISMRLCGLKGNKAYTDYTHLHFNGASDNEKKDWNDALIEALKLDRNKFPMICSPGKVIGEIEEGVKRSCKIEGRTLVYAGMGDSAASGLGAGLVKPGYIFDVAGTASVFSMTVNKAIADEENKTLFCPRSPIEGLYTPLAYIGGGGLCISWIKGIMSEEYSTLESKAEKIEEGSEGLYFIPHFSGRVCPYDKDMRGGFIGLTSFHTKAHMYRAVLESIAMEYRIYYDIIKEKCGKANCIIGVGGGTKSKLLNKIKSNILGLNYYTLPIVDSAVRGCGLIARYGNKIEVEKEERNLLLNKKLSSISEEKSTLRYKGVYERYKKVLEYTSQLYKNL